MALPSLPSLMLPAQSRAAGATRPPKRFVFFFSGNGQRPANYYPKEPLPWKVVAPNVREISLVGPDPISTVFGDDFTPLKSKILLIRGLDFIMKKGGGHDGPCTLSGFLRSSAEDTTRWVSIDQVMANSRGVYPTPPPIGQPRSVHVYTRGNQSPGAMVASTAAGVPVPHELDVTKTWDNLWKGFIDPGQMGPEVDLALQKRIVQRSVMDRVRAEYDNLRKHPRLGSEDRKRLDAHMTALNDLNGRLMQGTVGTKPVGCAQPLRSMNLAQDEANLPMLTKLNMDVLAAAIKCDRTRVATFMLCNQTDTRTFKWLEPGGLGDHRDLSHMVYTNPAGDKSFARDRLGRINNWYGKQVAYFLGLLNQVEDPVTGATYLDNTVVYWGNGDGGNDGEPHSHWGHPVMLAGGGFKTGRYLDFREVMAVNGEDQGPRSLYLYNGTPTMIPKSMEIRGRPYNSLLISLMKAMGVAQDEYETPGKPGFGDYSGNVSNQYNIADGQKELPYI